MAAYAIVGSSDTIRPPGISCYFLFAGFYDLFINSLRNAIISARDPAEHRIK